MTTREERRTAHLRQMMERYTKQFRALEARDAPSLARELHAEIDAVLERDRKTSATSADIQCRKGCAHCCHGPVEIWPHEAALLLAAARAIGLQPDPARLERQSRASIDTWRQQPAADRACAFLGEDGACQVYESRPNACRKLLVVTAPERCDAEQQQLESVERWFSWEAEILESAALETFGRDLMPRALLAAATAQGAGELLQHHQSVLVRPPSRPGR